MQKPLSRLEKFLYALCSLDSSELPNPLSRLEVLLNCLVTGETPPTFEPLSRNEKYLMAILGSYHDELPNPISSGEKLLYKLATGDDNIDDIGEALSRYEELLTYMIGNGCLDGPIDVEYVTYVLTSGQNTLYNTKEVPAKSAVLKGRTLVNMTPQDRQHADGISNVNLTEGRLTWSAQSDWLKLYFVVNAKPNSKYIIKYHSINENVGIFCRPETTDPHSGWYENVTTLNQIITTYDVGAFVISLENAIASSDLWVQDFMIIEYQDGMENWDIPYFEGMKSVQMPVLTTTGKNLFNLNEAYDDSKDNGISFSYKNTGVVLNGSKTDKTLNSTSRMLNINHLLKPGKTYSISSNYEEEIVCSIRLTKKDGRFDYKKTFEMNNQYSKADVYIQLTNDTTIDNFVNSEILIQLEESSSITPYEPYKSNILTTSEEVELRGIGDVKDELNLLTGEVVERICEIVLDGSEDWVLSTIPDSNLFYTSLNNLAHKKDYLNSIRCDKLVVHDESTLNTSTSPNGISGYVDWYDTFPNENWLYIKYTDSEHSVEKFKQWLSQNPITVQYELATESIETVDISVVNQDGNNAKLSSFEDITYVAVTSEGILPDVELEVATKNEEVLNTMSLRMDDIYATQATLEETSNAQSENVDATMMATTEIYEGLL